MNTRMFVVGGAVATAVVAGVILSLQSFDAEKVSCEGITEARTALQSMFDTGVSASVAVYADEKAAIDERLSQCLNAKPATAASRDFCASAHESTGFAFKH